MTGLCEVPCEFWGPDSFRCNGVCTRPGDPQNCGGCGVVCGGLEWCQQDPLGNFACACPTSPEYAQCGGVCTNIKIDENACGDCTTSCGTGEKCFNGTCTVEETFCDAWGGCNEYSLCCYSAGGCVDSWTLKTDENNCGGCGVACARGDRCLNGICTTPSSACGMGCNAPRLFCCDDGLGGGTCVDEWQFESDPDNCGGCGIVCGTNESCQNFECRCPSVWGDTNYTSCGGVCTYIGSDPLNCGGCNIECTSDELCISGSCEAGTGPNDCGGTCNDTSLCCETSIWPGEACVELTDMAYNPEHCGGCAPCGPGEQCRDFACFCDARMPAYCDTDGDGIDECVSLMEPATCGSCTNSCSGDEMCSDRPGLQTPECICPSSWGDANYIDCNGVCTNIAENESNCGACGNTCAAGDVCVLGTCHTETGTSCVGMCLPGDLCCASSMGWDSCANIQWDFQNCGDCGVQCDFDEQCEQGNCCKQNGNLCQADSDCCGGTCFNDTCCSGSANDVFCVNNDECCSGYCDRNGTRTCQVKPPPVCGDFTCEPGEDNINCPDDCPTCNYNGACEFFEDPMTCSDCMSPCNFNNSCEPWEDPSFCPDCMSPCNFNGACEPWEDPAVCPDCGGVLCIDNGVCEPFEPPYCFDCGGGLCNNNGMCDPGEDPINCPADCG
ncbi:MAG: hypothetical protein COW42_10320 [Deltaproteobacteria bacterium CG17_big_fil_post_rev_8_21_14_2_50_63_7]|nr:MAG: hypothetical protein COW42_10320 [Deltaproteobacteria bacterium CG17_big_fil_post_rev_8_21_14_2_50_63_7]